MAAQATAYPFEDGYIVKFPMGHSVFVKDLAALPVNSYVVAKKVGKTTEELINEGETEITEKEAE